MKQERVEYCILNTGDNSINTTNTINNFRVRVKLKAISHKYLIAYSLTPLNLIHSALANLNIILNQFLDVFSRGQKGFLGDKKTVSTGFISDEFQTMFEVIGQLFEKFL